LHYAKKSYVVVPVKQDPGLRAKPDLIAIPVDLSTMRPLYSKAIAVEVESCNEVEVHPDQVAHNWVKESVKDFAEVHTWTWDKCFNRLGEIYEKAGADRSRVKIFCAKWSEAGKSKEKEREKEKKKKAEQGPATPATNVGEPLESRATQVSSLSVSQPVVSVAPIYEEGEEVGQAGEVRGIVRRFKASDGFEYTAVFSDDEEAKRFDRFCTGRRSVARVEGSTIKCVDRATGASVAVRPSSLSRAS
jgi:hypothetical protein